jgi:SAM-dependent methyltransferase
MYRLSSSELEAASGKLWALARGQLRTTASAIRDGRRLRAALAMRRRRSRRFFASAAQDWDRLRDELYGARFHWMALLGLVAERLDVAELGCGTGRVAEALAPYVRRVVAVDGSAAMLDAAADRLGEHSNVELRRGELEQLPLEDGEVDAATLVLVLHHVADPTRVLAEARRVIRPPGRHRTVRQRCPYKEIVMSVVTRDRSNPFEAARTAGREPFKVRDLALAEQGRSEIRLAEQEMPGLMALRERCRGQRPPRWRARA